MPAKKEEQTDTERITKETGKKPAYSSGHRAAQKEGEAANSRAPRDIGREDHPVYIKR